MFGSRYLSRCRLTLVARGARRRAGVALSCCARFGDSLPTVAIENAKNDNLLFVSFGTREKIGLDLCVACRRRPRAAVTSLIGCGESEEKKTGKRARAGTQG